MQPLHAPLPSQAPRTRNLLGRWFGRSVLRLGGWRVIGEFPPLDKLVIIVAPHSSAWDAIWGLAAKLALGVHIVFMAKQELFRGPLGWLLRRFGAEPVDRSAPRGLVGQAVDRLRDESRIWFLLAPEGTRRRVQKWKSGFWHIARAAQVPVMCAYFHYPQKIIGLGPVFEMTDDLGADMARVREFYRPWVGKRRGTE